MTDPLAAARAQRRSPDEPPADPRPAATVVLVRPGRKGLEVLLTRRPAAMAFAAGLNVFPGGRLDPGDGAEDHPLAGGLTRADAAARLAGTLPPDEALAHFVAAARETLEETGISVVAADLIPLSRWVTPPALARRFDVWFFAAPVPAGTDVAEGSEEVEEATWITPAAGLRGARDGSLAMLQPTLVTLEQLDGLPDVEAIADAFRPGPHLDAPTVDPTNVALAHVEQRWVGGIPGRRASGWLVGQREIVLVDPADPTCTTSDAIEAALAEHGGAIVGIALTGLGPAQQAGVELYAAGGGVPVVAGPGAAALAPYPVQELHPGDRVPFGDLAMTATRADRADAGATDYRLPGNRRLPRRGFRPASGRLVRRSAR
jgi:8-oxo-dGTP pyrophosphatase MutT (NUDIX family)